MENTIQQSAWGYRDWLKTTNFCGAQQQSSGTLFFHTESLKHQQYTGLKSYDGPHNLESPNLIELH